VFEVVGEEKASFLNAIAPSVVEPGEEFTLTIRAEDRFRNVASAGPGELEVLLDGEPFRTFSAESEALVQIENVAIPSDGVHRFTVRTADGTLQGASNPILVERNPVRRIYWGETHGHTGMAEGQGSAEGYFRFGRDAARLDFLTLSEHDRWLDDGEWRTLQRLAEEYRAPGRFTPILGFEWTNQMADGGHHNVFFRDAPGRRRVGTQEKPLLDELYAELRAANRSDDVLIIPHAHQPGDWTRSDKEMQKLVEIQSSHGTFDWFGNRYLQNGFRIGFVGASDNHTGQLIGHRDPWFRHPGSYATERTGNEIRFRMLTRGRSAAILLRLRAAGADTRVVVDMESTQELRGTGSDQREPQRLPARVETFRLGSLGGQVDRREVRVLDHTDALSVPLVSDQGDFDQDFRYLDVDDLQPGDYYYVRVRQVDGAMAWSSPFWVGELPASGSD